MQKYKILFKCAIYVKLFEVCFSLCDFPSFLSRPLVTGETRYWLTEMKYHSTTAVSESQREIYVHPNELVVKVKFQVPCLDDFEVHEPCFQTEVIYSKRCIGDMGSGKYHVLHAEGTSSFFTCIKFIQHNLNVIQVFSGLKDGEQGADVCDDQNLFREEWPWIAPVQEQWSFCPQVGGYDFRTFASRNKELCPEEWRPSRLEVECVQGDGLIFTFPTPHCSPLANSDLELHLQCWASWTEEGYQFIIASRPDSMPQYALRFPLKMDEVSSRVYWYFSPVCPVNKRGLPTGNLIPVTLVELVMNQSEPGLCFDESAMCADYAKEGRCTNSALYQYANYCKRSCGLCNLLPSPRPECRFPSEYHGDWHFFERDRDEKVTITSEHLVFSQLGEFVCKSKHWNINYYKLFSLYSNGCRPRYTCIHFEKDADDVLKFQISFSSRIDQSFELCVFRDASRPLGNRIHSAQLKTLIPWQKVKANTCGLEGTTRIFTHPDNERRACWGTLSDWNQRSCGSESRLRLHLQGQCKVTETASKVATLQEDYICIAYIRLDEEYAILITKSTGIHPVFSCWALKTYAERKSYSPWQEAYLLPTAQCGTSRDFDTSSLASASLTVMTEGDSVERPCGQVPTNRLHPTRGEPAATELGLGENLYDTDDVMRKDKYIYEQNPRNQLPSASVTLEVHCWRLSRTAVFVVYSLVCGHFHTTVLL